MPAQEAFEPSPTISIIIPVLNEDAALRELLPFLRSMGDGSSRCEVIVADGGSTDRSVETARSRGARVISAARGRARQMNAGARIARAPALFFLHADTRPPKDALQRIDRTLADDRTALVAFRLQIDHSRWVYRSIERGAHWRSRWLALPYGDQSFSVRAKDFREVGGFPEIPVMEDVALVTRLRGRGRIRTLDAPILASARRWERSGVWRTTIAHLAAVVAFRLGVSPGWIARRMGRDAPPQPSRPSASPLPRESAG